MGGLLVPYTAQSGLPIFFLHGSCLENQENFLREQGFKFHRVGRCSCIQTEDEFARALRLIWVHKISGWWDYKGSLLYFSICTNHDFESALRQV